MKTLSHCLACLIKKEAQRCLPAERKRLVPQFIEIFWFCLTLFLFVLMGPFSAIAVLIGLGSLASEKNREQMIEPAHL